MTINSSVNYKMVNVKLTRNGTTSIVPTVINTTSYAPAATMRTTTYPAYGTMAMPLDGSKVVTYANATTTDNTATSVYTRLGSTVQFELGVIPNGWTSLVSEIGSGVRASTMTFNSSSGIMLSATNGGVNGDGSIDVSAYNLAILTLNPANTVGGSKQLWMDVNYGTTAAHYLSGMLRNTSTATNVGILYSTEDLEYGSRVVDYDFNDVIFMVCGRAQIAANGMVTNVELLQP
jgi:hypothetical protein